MLTMLLVLATLGGDPEVARVQAHLAGAEAQLRAADTGGLTDVQRARRAMLIDELARYRARGRFPRNLDHAVLTPYFIDDRGVRCAMAHLIEVGGGAALVARVAATANNAYVRELAGDAALLAWLRNHGLTVAEAARVQPAYMPEVGRNCRGFDTCREGPCLPAPDAPDELMYCTKPCDPADATTCPVGMQDVQMTCERVGTQPLCVYPGRTPGVNGWPCRTDGTGGSCWKTCYAEEGEIDGVCVEDCLDDAGCPEDLECRPLHDSQLRKVCLPTPSISTGCATGGGGAGAALTPTLLVGLALARRRRRRRVHPAPARRC